LPHDPHPQKLIEAALLLDAINAAGHVTKIEVGIKKDENASLGVQRNPGPGGPM
jgi:hypothetical protein